MFIHDDLWTKYLNIFLIILFIVVPNNNNISIKTNKINGKTNTSYKRT